MVITGYMLVAMWASFVFGGAAKQIAEEISTHNENASTVYKVDLDRSGEMSSVCEEPK